MNLTEYQREATQTFKPRSRLSEKEAELANWAIGVANEAGELAGLIKHILFHKQRASKVEIAKEVGDVLWYLSALCSNVGIDLAVAAELNLAKLKHRHGKSFSFQGSRDRHKLELKFEETAQYREIISRLVNV